jgi:hypothetical protein
MLSLGHDLWCLPAACVCCAEVVSFLHACLQALLQYTISSSAAAKAAAAAAAASQADVQQQQHQQQQDSTAALLQQLHTGEGFDAEQVRHAALCRA